MIQVFNEKMKHLLRGDEGFAMALTLIVYPVLLIMVGGVFVYGEIARQKIHFQNAADAASYAGAVVQADTLSRIAVLNKVMAWTYVQANKMEMDYVVNDWLGRAATEFSNEKSAVSAANELGTTCVHFAHKSQRIDGAAKVLSGETATAANGYGYYIGLNPDGSHLMDKLDVNGNQLLWSKDAAGELTIGGVGDFADRSNDQKTRLDDTYTNIAAMNAAIQDLQEKSQSRIAGTMAQVMTGWGISEDEYTATAPSGSAYTKASADESAFLLLTEATASFNNYPWWKLDTSAGIQRNYDSSSGLDATFHSGHVVWTPNNDGTLCTAVASDFGARTISAKNAYGDSSQRKTGAKPLAVASRGSANIRVNIEKNINMELGDSGISLLDFIKAPAKLLGIDFTALDALTVKCSSAARACPKGKNGYSRTLPAGIIKETDWNAVWFAE